MIKNEEKSIEIASSQPFCDGNDNYREMALFGARKMAEFKDGQNIVDLGGWSTEEPTIDCFCLVESDDFPKNCRYVVAEWDNDAKCFYSESSDRPISCTRYKIIEPNNFLMNI